MYYMTLLLKLMEKLLIIQFSDKHQEILKYTLHMVVLFFFLLKPSNSISFFLSKRSKMSCRSRNKEVVIHAHKLVYANAPQKFSEPKALAESFLTYLKLELSKTTGETIFLTIKLQKEKLTLQ